MFELLEYSNTFEQIEHQEELKALNTYFKKNHSQFWVIFEDKTLTNLIGCIGLKVIDYIGIVKKMYIKKDYRGKRMGVSTLLMNTILQHALKCQLSYLCLGTNDELISAKRFYEKNDWKKINRDDLPENILSAFNIADNVLYKYELP
ncbi:unnamed protein product [Cunninghamella echinulata]